MGLALVSNDGKHAGQVLDRITERLRELPDAHLGDCRRELITGRGGEDDQADADGVVDASVSPLRRSVDAELLKRAMQDPDLASLAAAETRHSSSNAPPRSGRSDGGAPRPEATP